MGGEDELLILLFGFEDVLLLEFLLKFQLQLIDRLEVGESIDFFIFVLDILEFPE